MFLVSGLLMLFALTLGMSAARFYLRRYRRNREPATVRHCRCGYTLEKLERIRCPECGRVFGFDATPEELGLSDEELRRATEARERRKAEGVIPRSAATKDL